MFLKRNTKRDLFAVKIIDKVSLAEAFCWLFDIHYELSTSSQKDKDSWDILKSMKYQCLTSLCLDKGSEVTRSFVSTVNPFEALPLELIAFALILHTNLNLNAISNLNASRSKIENDQNWCS